MSDTAIAALSALGVSFITAGATILGVFLTNRANYKRQVLELSIQSEKEKNTTRNQKVELAYLNFSKWSRALFSYQLPFVKVMQGELDYNQAYDLVIDNDKTKDFDPDHMQLCVDLYMPHLGELFADVEAKRDKLNAVINDHRAHCESGRADGASFVQMYMDAMKEFDEAAVKFKHGLSESIA